MSVDLSRLTAHLSPQQQEEVKKAYHRREEHSTAAFLYCFFLGIFGAHRFYLRQWGKGFAHLIIPVAIAAVIAAGIALGWDPAIVVLVVIPLLIIALIWEIINLFTIDAEVYKRNLALAERLVAQSLLSDTTVERRGEAKLDAMMQANMAQSAAAAQRERAASDMAAESAAMPAPMPVAPASAAEEVASSVVSDTAAAVSTGHYDESSVVQISDDPAATHHAESDQPPAPVAWSVSETRSGNEVQTTSGAADEQEQVAGEQSMEARAEEEHAEATADSAGFVETVTHSHEETPYSVIDSVERMSTFAAAAATAGTDEALVEEAPLPTAEEAVAATAPDLPAPDLTDETIPPAASGLAAIPPRDVTDLGYVSGEAKPIADVTTEGGVPQRVSLPDDADVLVGLVGMQTIVAAQPATEPPAGADESVLLLVPEEAAPDTGVSGAGIGTGMGAEDTAPSMPSFPEAMGMAGAATALTGYAAWASDAPTLPSTPPEEPAAPAEPATGDETLAELAGYGAAPVLEQAAPPAPATPPSEYQEPHSVEPEPPHHSLRRIRVVRQVKVDGQVVEETSAEEFIDADADPEPVRQRLQEMLRQQAAHSDTNPGTV